MLDDPVVNSLVEELGEAGHAFISADVCSLLSSEALLDQEYLYVRSPKELMIEQLNKRPTLHDYEALGIGYRLEEDRPIGTIVMSFFSDEDAMADYEPRQQLAEEGLTREEPPQTYRESIFEIQESHLDGSVIVWKVRPVDDQTPRLFDMPLRWDMVFATCP